MARAKLREIAQAAEYDPRQALVDAIGDISGYECFHNRVLVATYIRPEKTKGGVYLADRSLAEDRFQNPIGLVLKIGPTAFMDDSAVNFGGVKIEPGDWVHYKPSNGIEMFFVDANGRDGTPCRSLEDIHIIGRIDDPSKIW